MTNTNNKTKFRKVRSKKQYMNLKGRKTTKKSKVILDSTTAETELEIK